MAEREVVLDKPVVVDEESEAVRKLTERAEKAEQELAKLKSGSAKSAAASQPTAVHAAADRKSSGASDAETKNPASPSSAGDETKLAGGEQELRQDSMMVHLLDSLNDGKDIGHYGRLVFAMVARHFMPHDEVLAWMTKDPDFSDEDAQLMLRQVEGRDYNPPRRDRILEWQAQQEFPILPKPEDPDCGNLYRNLKFPDEIYKHIGHYQEKKAESGE